jgi:hypothetical protein
MERAALLTLLLVVAVACSGGKSPMSSAKPAATASTAKPADPAAAPCDHKIVAMSDPAQRQIQCANGESFIVRQAADGKWYPEMRVRAGIVPGYATPDEAARARCCPPASE